MAQSTLARSANEFAVDLFQCYLKRHGDKYINLLLCPYLIYHSLAMMLVGAKGKTSLQLTQLLRIKQQQDSNNERHKEFLILAEQLFHGNHDFIHLASFIYLDKTTKRTEQFKSILKDYYETKPKKIDFGDVDLTVKTINEDVARTTENIYSDILSKIEAQKLEKSMLLVSAVFFRGFWLSNFTEVGKGTFYRSGDKDLRQPQAATVDQKQAQPQTQPQPKPGQRQQQKLQQQKRQLLPTKHPKEQPLEQQKQKRQSTSANDAQTSSSSHSINMMSKLDYLTVVSDDDLDARIIKMPFEASDLQMLIILPNDFQSNSAYLCNRINANKLDQIMNEFGKTKARSVRVSMPIFCIDSGKISIQSTLVTMGASDLFDKSKANMSGICENKQIWLNKIIHRCFIICDNRGAITSSSHEKARKRHAETFKRDGTVSIRTLMGVDEFIADHPFMYIILDSVTRAIVLIGLYTDPSETLEVVHENQLSPEEAHNIVTESIYKT